MEIEFSPTFYKQHKKAQVKIQTTFQKRLKLFLQNPQAPILRNHVLTGNYKNYRSINITGDWRALYSEHANKVVFEFLGTHSQLYK